MPEHGTEPEHVAEENWFVRLSRYADAVEEAITSGRVRIEPETRRNEVLTFARSGLADFSVSRPATRAGGWFLPDRAARLAARLGRGDAVGPAGPVFRRLGPGQRR